MSTKGEIYAGIRPESLETVEITQIRGATAALIDNLDHLDTELPQVKRAIAIAQTKYEEACMMAVKAVYLAMEPQDYTVNIP